MKKGVLFVDRPNMEKPHFVVKDIQDNYRINWYGKIVDANPVIKNNNPVFVLIGSQNRLELNTIDFAYIEKCAKRMTHPKGRQAVTCDSVRIYIKEVSGNEMLLGVLSHIRTKTFMPVYGKRKK